MPSPCSRADVHLIAELRRPPLDELEQLFLDRGVERRALVGLEQLLPPRSRARRMIEGAAARPSVVVVGRRDGGPPEAVAKPLQGVLGAEEVPAVADLDVRAEGEARVVDLGRGELVQQQVEQLAVRDELLERRDEPALEPSCRLPADVRTREER